MSHTYCFALLETSGNQRYIFGTNRLRHNIGASQAVYEAGTRFVIDALRAEGLVSGPVQRWYDPARFREWVSSQGPIERASEGQAAEVIFATSSKALILVRAPQPVPVARGLVTRWTASLLQDLPGLDATGVISPPFDWKDTTALHAARAGLSEAHLRARARLPRPAVRFQRLPVVEPCLTSGLPAETLIKVGGRAEPSSALARALRDNRNEAVYGRFRTLIKPDAPEFDTSEAPNAEVERLLHALDTEWGFDWMGVVHADGNGLGEIFRGLPEIVAQDPAAGSRQAVDTLRALSLDLEQCAEQAFREAAQQCFKDLPNSPVGERMPVLPVVVGGDDLTVVCDGRRAIRFARAYLDAFDRAVVNTRTLRAVAERVSGVPRIGACAGVAIVKPHFPFFLAYDLAEQLVKSAKQVKKKVVANGNRAVPCLALDYHVVHDTSAIHLETVRGRLQRGGSCLHGKPYVVSPLDQLDRASGPGGSWAKRHSINHLDAAMGALKADKDGKARLSASRSHALRAALHRDSAEAEALFELLRARHKGFAVAWEGTLFERAPDGEAFTRFQDALELTGLEGEVS